MSGLQHLDSPVAAARWLAARVTGQLRTDSRTVRPGDGFIAWPGYAVDGRQFVAAALAAGAAACVVEQAGVEAFALDGGRVASLAKLKAATGPLADAYYLQPSAQLDIVATTGTNGKTSTAWWTAQALSLLGRRCGVVGTLGVGEPGPMQQMQATGLTTPDPVTLHAALRGMVDQGFRACALEASSIGLVEHRLDALRIRVALFTNFTQDHLDFHGSMAAYWQAKRELFDWPGLLAAVINIDDAQGAALATELSSSALDLWTVSLHRSARLQALNLRYTLRGLAFEVMEGDVLEAGQQVPISTQLVGEFNASNLLVVLAGLRALGVPLAEAAAVAAQLTPVPGRVQRVQRVQHGSAADGMDGMDDVEVVVDYAHTPDALEKALKALRPLAQARGGRLWCVFGCGGNRDATKRPLMGAIAARDADHVVITSDNPRLESPAVILAQILVGVTGHDDVDVIEDRRAAIHGAVREAARGDVILLAGKGHEDYQDLGGVKRPFSDVQEALAALQIRRGHSA